MSEHLPQDTTTLARALLEVLPVLIRRIHGDVPLECGPIETTPGLREVSELRTTPGQLTLLRVLIDHGRCTMQELAEHLAVAPSTATAMVKRLLVQGYVERNRDEVDWRAVWVKPTERGRQVFAVFDQVRLISFSNRLEHLSKEERDILIAAVPVLRHLIAIDVSP
jgi:DNA-binding MarR family transcriptional regulator